MRSETKPSQDEEKNGQEPLLPPIQPVIDFGSVVIKNSRAAIHCLTIAGQIEGHMLLPNTQKATKYEHVLPLLAYLEESDEIDGVLFLQRLSPEARRAACSVTRSGSPTTRNPSDQIAPSRNPRSTARAVNHSKPVLGIPFMGL